MAGITVVVSRVLSLPSEARSELEGEETGCSRAANRCILHQFTGWSTVGGGAGLWIKLLISSGTGATGVVVG
jgi:hypothetical protein